MQDLYAKLTALEKVFEERERKLQKSLTVTSLIYAFLILLVAFYALYVPGKIKELTSPEDVASIVTAQLADYLPQLRRKAIIEIRKNSSELASSLIREAARKIPSLEKPLGNTIDGLLDYISHHVENIVIPQFTKTLEENAHTLREKYGEFQDEEKMQGLALLLVDIFDEAMDDYLNENFIRDISELKQQLVYITREETQITRRELAQREVLVNWVYLANNQETGDSIFYRFIERVSSQFNMIMEEEDSQLDMENINISTTSEL